MGWISNYIVDAFNKVTTPAGDGNSFNLKIVTRWDSKV
jgi:hypothetical protein